MYAKFQEVVKPSKRFSLANSFSRVGWMGFWAQIAIGFVPAILTIYAIAVSRNAAVGTRGGFALVDVLTAIGLLVLAFTTFWFYRYTRLAGRIADPQKRPPLSDTRQATWTGAAASTLGMVFSMLVLLFEVAQLLIYFLRAPQVGIPTVQTTGGGAASWLSASDIVSLLILTLTLLVEFAVLAMSLWLLFRCMSPSDEYPDAGE
ncbi:MAG: DUF3611 family protein [Hyphomicrobiaceae bacterium]